MIRTPYNAMTLEDEEALTITISRVDAEALVLGPKAGQVFRGALVRELEAIKAALKAEG